MNLSKHQQILAEAIRTVAEAVHAQPGVWVEILGTEYDAGLDFHGVRLFRANGIPRSVTPEQAAVFLRPEAGTS